MHKILSDDYVTNEQIVIDGNDTILIWVNVVNLDDFLENNHHCEMLFGNLSNIQIQQAKEKFSTILITPGSIKVKLK
jgi:hypothetical protein